MHQSYANVIYFQIMQVTLPTSYEDIIVETQVEVQKKKMQEYEKQVQKIKFFYIPALLIW